MFQGESYEHLDSCKRSRKKRVKNAPLVAVLRTLVKVVRCTCEAGARAQGQESEWKADTHTPARTQSSSQNWGSKGQERGSDDWSEMWSVLSFT